METVTDNSLPEGTIEVVKEEPPKKPRKSRVSSVRADKIAAKAVEAVLEAGPHGRTLKSLHEQFPDLAASTIDRRLDVNPEVKRLITHRKIRYVPAEQTTVEPTEVVEEDDTPLLSVQVYPDHVRIPLEDFYRMLEALT